MPPPSAEYDVKGRLVPRYFINNAITTAKYTLISFVPKNLFEQFRNVANLYFLFLVILQCIPIFGVTAPVVSALPLIVILIITAIKDGIEDLNRHQSDKKVNNAKVLTLSHWRNVNLSDESRGRLYYLYAYIGWFLIRLGVENEYTRSYQSMALQKNEMASIRKEQKMTAATHANTATNAYATHGDNEALLEVPMIEIDTEAEAESNLPQENRTLSSFSLSQSAPPLPSSSSALIPPPPPALPTPPSPTSSEPKLASKLRARSDTLRSMSRKWMPNTQKKECLPYRPGSVPHSVLFRIPTREVGQRPDLLTLPSAHTTHTTHTSASATCANSYAGDPPATHCKTTWQTTHWQNIQVGDYVKILNNENVPADIVILSTSDNDHVCYVETQNLDGETNLKSRQGLLGTSGIRTEHDCERARFYIESEPPHVNLYQYSGVLRWEIETPEDTATVRSGVSHQKADPITYSNVLLRGCVVRNTDWVIGMVVYTGNETKIMLNSGKTPSKRSKIAKATNPHVIANFVILAILAIVSSILDSVYFNAPGSSRFFDYGIEGQSGSYSGFLTFWVTLILYQNIVPISLYISVEIVKTCAAYFIYSDIDMYHAPTDTPCLPKTWNISDDLGQIEYVFSDKTGTLTQNVMEFRKCTINGVSYGIGSTEAMKGARLRTKNTLNTMGHTATHTHDPPHDTTYEKDNFFDDDFLESTRHTMYQKQAQLFDNPYVGHPTFIDSDFFDDLGKDDEHAQMMEHFGVSLAICHTAIPEYPKATSDVSSSASASSADEEGDIIRQISDSSNPPPNTTTTTTTTIEYKAQSPDEAALVATARDMGFVFLKQNAKVITVLVKGREERYTLLNVLEFNSTRKRMSVIVKPEKSDKIVLLCKGADSVIYERLCEEFGQQKNLEESQRKVRESTASALEEFANEGLRTLCLSYRFISRKEYTAWNKRHEEASASIHAREEKLEQVYELIEREMLLMGGTAIEDRLQLGVPETIAELSKSGIKLWVLTGDKTETAINIGFSCNLLTVDMELIVIKSQTRDETKQQLKRALEQGDAENGTDRKRALVIDGTTLRHALSKDCRSMFLSLGMQCASVLCCRVSPKQKAEVVLLVKKGLKVMTLAIGDGANDVSMIQAANVGIGISGVEGRQAVMASDYAIAQFRYLHKLLLVHGRWSYLRTAEMIMGFFFKNIAWTFVLFWYQIFCQFNGSMLFDYALVTLYNLMFTSLPIIFLGIWDQDLSAEISLRYPELYRMGLRNDKFKLWRFWLTTADAIYQSSVSFFFPYMLLVAGAFDANGYSTNGLYEIGTIMSSVGVTVANLFSFLSLNSYTWPQVVVTGLSVLVYYVFVSIYSQFNVFIFAGHVRLLGTGSYWLVFILTIVACFVPRMAAKYILHQYYPHDNDIIREIELVQRPHQAYDQEQFIVPGLNKAKRHPK
ncbi:hypothetical protein BDF14DRAFT_1743655 [Spinellus fusiger]|nr:hypothetical protein BDF14DRAFT_1743655 [Spinellus fusiger]